MARLLDVYLQRQHVGELEQDDSGMLWFAYTKDWLNSQSSRPISVSLPLRVERFPRNECRPFFAGLLPEENSRKLIARLFGVSEKNDFSLLEKIGGECAGAVSLMPPGQMPEAGTASYEEITSEALAARIRELPQRPLLAGRAGMRLSLAGAQGKLVVAIEEGRYFLPLEGSPSSHILKPQGAVFEGLVENEYFCMRLAKLSGLDVAEVELSQIADIRFLQIRRYDRRKAADGSWERIHQEDFCQALGIAPELKYQQEGGPNFKKCFELVRSVSTAPGPDVLRLFDAVIFNFLIGNHDAHGKNFSFLHDAGQTRLAPLYDLVCTQAYEDLSDQMAMKIGGERKPQRLQARNWRKFFAEAGLNPAVATKRLNALTNRVRTAAHEMAGTGFFRRAELAGIVYGNCDRLLQVIQSE